jgi:DNA polymerase III delta prime subunit
MRRIRIFISYAHEDYEAVSRLSDRLKAAGYDTWVDRESLRPGAKWETAITKAIQESHIFMACLSRHSANKRGLIQREIKRALDVAELLPSNDIFVIPVLLDDFPLPEILQDIQGVYLFGERAKDEWQKLLNTLEATANRISRREEAKQTLYEKARLDLQKINDLRDLAQAGNVMKAMPIEAGYSSEIQNRIIAISEIANDYRTRLTPIGQIKVLKDLREEIVAFLNAMSLVSSSTVEADWQLLGQRWLEIVVSAEKDISRRLNFLSIPNPYVAGAPLQTRDFSLLKGRRDIVEAIETYILNTGQRLSLLLYGRRRTGKSSTLLNMPRLLSSQFEPVYVDCQDAKWHESDQAFCYNLARDVFDRLYQSEADKRNDQPQLKQFEKNSFTRLDQYLDQFEQLAAQRGKRILLSFDEYEGLEEGIAGGNISKNVLGKLRNIIQHRERIVVLVSGSHRFEELTGLNWASYLINTRTLELSFLDKASARELLTEPVPQLQYEDGVLDKILRFTHCQPYLLQAVASELVNHLNDRQQTTATHADLDAAVEKVLISAGAYFANTWREDNSEAEQTVLCAFATDEGDSVLTAKYQAALQSLCRKEMLERTEDGYRLAVPLFGRWIVKNQVPEALPELLVRVA